MHGETVKFTVFNHRTFNFRCVSSHAIHLAEELKSNPLFADLWNRVKDNEALANRILARTTCSQVSCKCDRCKLVTLPTNPSKLYDSCLK